jgi:hypothetical protein
MPVTAGPIYPGVKDGLVFAIDPANKDSWAGPTSDTVDSLTLYNPVSGSIYNDTSGSYGNNESFAFDSVDDNIATESNISVLNLTTKLSITVWVYITTTSNYRGIFTKGNNNNERGSYSASVKNTTNNTIRFYLGVNSSTVVYADTSTNLSGNTWHNLSFIYDGTGASNTDKVKIYLNGSPETLSFNGTMLTNVFSNNSPFHLGTYGYPSLLFNGNIGPLLIYNRALSAGEILQNYNRVKGRFGLS